MELRDRDRLKAPIAPGEYRQTYRAFALQGVMLNPPPGHLPRRQLEPQDVELRRDSLATVTCKAMTRILATDYLSFISFDEAASDELKARGNNYYI